MSINHSLTAKENNQEVKQCLKCRHFPPFPIMITFLMQQNGMIYFVLGFSYDFIFSNGNMGGGGGLSFPEIYVFLHHLILVFIFYSNNK